MTLGRLHGPHSSLEALVPFSPASSWRGSAPGGRPDAEAAHPYRDPPDGRTEEWPEWPEGLREAAAPARPEGHVGLWVLPPGRSSRAPGACPLYCFVLSLRVVPATQRDCRHYPRFGVVLCQGHTH